jgi:putative flippase GtrA
MGLVIGAGWKKLSLPLTIVRGAIIGLLVSFAFYSSTGFGDVVSFLAGIVYGIIIEFVAFKFSTAKTR